MSFVISFFKKIKFPSNIYFRIFTPLGFSFICGLISYFISQYILLDFIDANMHRNNLELHLPFFSFVFVFIFIIFFVFSYLFYSQYLTHLTISKMNERLKAITYIDQLTGLRNKNAFWEDITDFIKKHEQQKAYLLCLDIDGFKKINEVFGYSAGDEVLRQFSARLNAIVDTKEVSCYRVGGDEFTILIKNLNCFYSLNDVSNFAKNLLKITCEPFVVHDKSFSLSLNIGIAQFPIDGSTAEELFKNCDLSVYDAIEKGKNTYAFYSEKVGIEIKNRNLIETLLLNAEKKDFYLLFQPKTQYINGHFLVVGAEVLLRWKNEQLGEVLPSIFIPLAEEIGIMERIGQWVFEETVKKISHWNKTHNKKIKVSVNLSVQQFKNKNLVYDYMNILNEYNVSPEQIIIEITESTMMKDFNSSNSILKEFSDNGFKISIDDFGTGYSSLSYLKKFLVDELKIDKSFTNDVLVDEKSRTIVSTIIVLAQNLGLNVVVEGVENKEQLDWFHSIGNIQFQGYYFSKPIKEQDFLNYWKTLN